MNNNQRTGSISNAHVGRDFEKVAQKYFKTHGIELEFNFSLKIGSGIINKAHSFDLGLEKFKIIVECKSHTWTKTLNVPSAKMTTWNEAMYYFSLAPLEYRKILFVLQSYNEKKNETLAEYYLRTNEHLIPAGVEFIEFDEATGKARKLR